jgi:hypothetical protein
LSLKSVRTHLCCRDAQPYSILVSATKIHSSFTMCSFSILIYTLCVCVLHHFTSTQLQMQLNLASCSHQVPKGFHKFPSCYPKTFLITPEFFPIWFAQSSTLMYINWKHILKSSHVSEVKIF